MSVKTFIDGCGPFHRLPGAAPGAPGMVLTSTSANKVEWLNGIAAASATYQEFTLDVKFSPGIPQGEGEMATCLVAQAPKIDGAAKTRVDVFIDGARTSGIFDCQTE